MQKEKTASYDLLNGPVARTLFLFSFPFMLSTLLQTLYSTTDTIVVGQFLGSAGLSAVSNGSQLMQMLTSVAVGFMTGGQVLIAQAKGAGDGRKLQKIVETLFLLGVTLTVALGLLAVTLSGTLLTLLRTPEEAREQARLYIVICGAGLVFTGLYNLFSAVLRGMGDSKHPLLFVVIATGLNVVLDILFIAVFRWNVAGAALATVIGQAVSVVFSAVYLNRHAAEFSLSFDYLRFRPDKKTAGQICRLGFPMALQLGAVQISFLFVSRMINALGVTVSAAFGVFQKIKSLPGFITGGFGMGSASMIGQNLGARRPDRVSKTVKFTLLYCAAVDLVVLLLELTVPQTLFRLFTADRSVLEYASMCCLAAAIEMPAAVFMPACNSLVSAQGFVELSFTVAILDAFAGRIFFCWLLGSFFGMGAFGYFLGYIMGTYVTAIIVALYYFTGWWKKRAALV